MRIRMQLLALGAVAVTAVAVGVTAAGASPGVVKATTHSHQHPDTTNCVTSVTSDNGPVWAYDNLSRQITATPTAATGVWTVTVVDNGSFTAFSEPNNADCTTDHPLDPNVTGSVKGSITYTVTSTGTPDAANLPSQLDGAVSTSATIRTLFGDPAATFAGGDYLYTYRAGTSVYSQDGGISGNITAH
jgi:hypothetical protein